MTELPDDLAKQIKQAQADSQPGQHKGDVVPVVELAMLAHLLEKHKNLILIDVVDQGAEWCIDTVHDLTGELHPFIHIFIER